MERLYFFDQGYRGGGGGVPPFFADVFKLSYSQE